VTWALVVSGIGFPSKGALLWKAGKKRTNESTDQTRYCGNFSSVNKRAPCGHWGKRLEGHALYLVKGEKGE